MAKTIKLNNNAGLFRAKIIDCQANQPFDLADVDDQFIVFYKPDGTRFEKQGVLVEDLPDNTGEFFIEYENSLPEESIVDLRGSWGYTGKVKLVTDDEAEASTRIIFWVVWLVTVDHPKNIQRILDTIQADPSLHDGIEDSGKFRTLVFGDPPFSKEDNKFVINERPAVYVTTKDSLQKTRYEFGFSNSNNQNQVTVEYDIVIMAYAKDNQETSQRQLYELIKNLQNMVNDDPTFTIPISQPNPGTDPIFSRSVISDPKWKSKRGTLENNVILTLLATIGVGYLANFPGIGDVVLLSKPNALEGIIVSEDREQSNPNRVLTENGDFGSLDVEYESTVSLDDLFRAKFGVEEDVTITTASGVISYHVKYISINPTVQFDGIERTILHMELIVQ